MDHVTLDRAGAHDGDFDHQIVQAARLHARQHGHLRAAFDLERADRIGVADHVIGRPVILRDIGHVPVQATMFRQQVEAAAHAAEHAQAQHIDLHETQRVDIVLVPLDDLAVFHSGGLDRDELIEPVLGQHEAARMLRQMARKADQFLRNIQGHLQAAVAGIHVELFGVFGLHTVLAPAPDLTGERRGNVLGQAERFAHFTDGAAGAIAGHGGAQGGMGAAVGFIDPLDNFLAPFMFEIDVDIRRLTALGADEAFEQQIAFGRIDGGDTEHVADCAVGGTAAALAQDVLRTGKPDDAVNREEIRGIFQFSDETQFVLELGAHGRRHAVRIASCGTFPCIFLKTLLGGHARCCFLRILVAQFRQAEAAGVGDDLRVAQRVRIARKQAGHFGGRFQMTVGEAFALETGIVDRGAFANAGHDILQDAAAGCVIQHVTGGHAGDAGGGGHGGQVCNAGGIAGAAAQGERQVRAVVKIAFQRAQIFRQGGVRRVGQQNRNQAGCIFRQILPGEIAGALAGARLAAAEQAAQSGIGRAIGGIDQHGQRVAQI